MCVNVVLLACVIARQYGRRNYARGGATLQKLKKTLPNQAKLLRLCQGRLQELLLNAECYMLAPPKQTESDDEGAHVGFQIGLRPSDTPLATWSLGLTQPSKSTRRSGSLIGKNHSASILARGYY